MSSSLSSINGGSNRVDLDDRTIQRNEWTFTVDSALLRELGERLVGKPHVALAELVKNSYDADADHVDIFFESDVVERDGGSVRLRDGSIQVLDNGVGMNRDDFERFWMRVGSAHKQVERVSPNKKRHLTGSKGVGRFAVQFLARKIEIITSKEGWGRELKVTVDWDQAVEAGQLTEAKARWEERPSGRRFSHGSSQGTWIKLYDLNKEIWTEEDFKSLAREIWWLQPPLVDPRKDTSDAFSVELTTPVEGLVEEFDQQMGAYIDLWYAEVRGRLRPNTDGAGLPTDRMADISLQFRDGTHKTFVYPVPECHIDQLDFELRTYYLSGRQKYGIKVGEAREYFNENGGVYVYDAGFRLPFYGGKEHDWLGLEHDHAHRLSRSKLLPDELQIEGGMTYLPTHSRVLGVVHIDTSHERSKAEDPGRMQHLDVQVTRDRLVEGLASKQLRDIVRAALDFYAVTESRRAFKKKEENRPTVRPDEAVEDVVQLVEQYREEIPQALYSTLTASLEEASQVARAEKDASDARLQLMAPLATAGMAALAHEHEAAKQLHMLRAIERRLGCLDGSSISAEEVESIRLSLNDWIERSEKTRRLFVHLLDEENRQPQHRLLAKAVLSDVERQTEVLLRGVTVDLTGVDPHLRLPRGSLAEWSALFQNVFVNSMNAMLDKERRLIHVVSVIRGNKRTIRIDDSGIGIDLTAADQFFEPFARAMDISPERRGLGLGGAGIGLTIVRMIASNCSSTVRFIEPVEGFATSFQLEWKEK